MTSLGAIGMVAGIFEMPVPRGAVLGYQTPTLLATVGALNDAKFFGEFKAVFFDVLCLLSMFFHNFTSQAVCLLMRN